MAVRAREVLAGICFFSVMVAVGVAQDQRELPSLPLLIDAHAASIDMIREVEAQVTLTGERYTPEQVEPTRLATWQWAWQGDRERVRHVEHIKKPRDDGLCNNRGDVFCEGGSTKFLQNWDPENPAPIVPRDQRTVRARVYVRSRQIVGRSPRIGLLLLMTGLVGDRLQYSLDELVSESSPPAALNSMESVGGHKCFHIHAEMPATRGLSFGNTTYDIFLDPAFGFLVRRAAIEDRQLRGDGEAATWVYDRVVRDVLEFKDCGDGVFVPIKTELRHYEEGNIDDAYSRVTFTVDDLAVNQGVSSDAFDFRFPEHALVVFFGGDGQKEKGELWGPDNKPAMEILSFEDLPDLPPSVEPVRSRVSGKRLWLVPVCGIVLALLVLMVLLRLRRVSR